MLKAQLDGDRIAKLEAEIAVLKAGKVPAPEATPTPVATPAPTPTPTVGAASWPQIVACLTGLGLSTGEFWSEMGTDGLSHAHVVEPILTKWRAAGKIDQLKNCLR